MGGDEVTAAKPTDRQCLGCRVPIVAGTLTCFKCWLRLPLELRQMKPGLVRTRAMAEWFRINP